MRYFIKYNPSKEFVEMLYRYEGNENYGLSYLSASNIWMGSDHNTRDVAQFLSSPSVEEVTEEQMQEYIADHKKIMAKGQD